MFLAIKRKSIFIVLGVLLLAVGMCFAVSVSATGALSTPKSGKVVVIDAGHGGADGGVVGTTTGSKESEINLSIARNVKNFLKSNGYEVIMTRTTTDGLYGITTKNKKQKDMAARKRIIEESKADLVVSIHCNSYPLESSKGAQVFYAPKSEEGKKNADIMQGVLSKQLDTKRVAMPGDYFILQCSNIPSMLVECGFLTNKAEEKLLLTASYQEKVAYNIFTGIHTILAEKTTAAV